MNGKPAILLLLFFPLFLPAQSAYVNRHTDVDILHYVFRLSLNDTTDRIEGETSVRVLLREETDTDFSLDLKNEQGGKGMRVTSVQREREVLQFTHENDLLTITFPTAPPKGIPQIVTIRYAGVPADGLIIATNKFGDRTFFGDNWPNRASNWLPVVDHPSDKATCEWIVTAPRHYKTIGNGALRQEKDLGNGYVQTHWSELTPIPTKVMVIGVAPFAVQETGVVDDVPVTTWAYVQDTAKVFFDYHPAAAILQFFEDRLGDYPYEKLANVQSTTIFGGMENAGNIFYNEKTTYGFDHPDMVGLLAHEIAHQWFGNSVSETNFSHIWLSEGFATYLSAIYRGEIYGKEALDKELLMDRETVIGFARNSPTVPVVDSAETDLLNLLNPNSYQKGGWILHMLRQQVGDESFWKGLNRFYLKYRNANATTTDFQVAMQQVSGKNLNTFFNQWLYQPGVPVIRGTWQYKSGAKKVILRLQQEGKFLYDLPIEVGLYANAREIEKLEVLHLTKKKLKWKVSLDTPPASVRIDPRIKLLADMELVER